MSAPGRSRQTDPAKNSDDWEDGALVGGTILLSSPLIRTPGNGPDRRILKKLRGRKDPYANCQSGAAGFRPAICRVLPADVLWRDCDARGFPGRGFAGDGRHVD